MRENLFQIVLYRLITYQYSTDLEIPDNITIKYKPNIKQLSFRGKYLIIQHMHDINEAKQDYIDNFFLRFFHPHKYVVIELVQLFSELNQES